MLHALHQQMALFTLTKLFGLGIVLFWLCSTTHNAHSWGNVIELLNQNTHPLSALPGLELVGKRGNIFCEKKITIIFSVSFEILFLVFEGKSLK